MHEQESVMWEAELKKGPVFLCIDDTWTLAGVGAKPTSPCALHLLSQRHYGNFTWNQGLICLQSKYRIGSKT